MRRIVDWLTRQGRKARIILRAAPTWFTTAAAAVAYFNENLVGLLPADWQGDATELAVSVGAALAAAITLIRRVTPAAKADRGILPTTIPEPPTVIGPGV